MLALTRQPVLEAIMGDDILSAPQAKFCSKCKFTKPLFDFAKSKSRKDGYNGHCKACMAAWRLSKLDELRASARQRQQANKERENARAARWRQQNKDYAKKYMATWLAENRDRKSLADKNYRLANIDSITQKKKARYALMRDVYQERMKAYAKKNREKFRPFCAANSRKRYANKLKATPGWANDTLMLGFYLEAERLKKETGQIWEVDHIVPLQSKIVCGLHCEANLRVVSLEENRSKGNRWWPDMPESCQPEPEETLTGFKLT